MKRERRKQDIQEMSCHNLGIVALWRSQPSHVTVVAFGASFLGGGYRFVSAIKTQIHWVSFALITIETKGVPTLL